MSEDNITTPGHSELISTSDAASTLSADQTATNAGGNAESKNELEGVNNGQGEAPTETGQNACAVEDTTEHGLANSSSDRAPDPTATEPDAGAKMGETTMAVPTGNAESKNTPSKVVSSVKTTGKTVGNGPPTPTVKKILNSGTFGAGSVKNAPVVPLKTSVSGPTTSTSSVKKASLSAPSTASTTATKRLSTVPTKATPVAPIAKPSLSASTTVRATHANNPTRTVATSSTAAPRTIATSAPRPRASVSESVSLPARKPLASRPSVSGSPAKPALPGSSATSRARTAGGVSISSIKELKQDARALEALQLQVDELTTSVKDKTGKISALEAQIATLTSVTSLRRESVGKSLGDQRDKANVEQEFVNTKNALHALRAEMDDHVSAFDAVQLELEEAKALKITQTEVISTLQVQIETLETEVKVYKRNLEELHASHGQVSADAARTASVEHAALVKAHADLATVTDEAEALRLAHIQALQNVTGRVQELETQVAQSAELAAELAQLIEQKEESANKISELEVEILELKEASDKADDAQRKTATKLAMAEDQLAAAIAVSEKLTSQMSASDVAHSESLESAKKDHEKMLHVVQTEQVALAAQLSAAQDELRSALTNHEQSKAESKLLVEERARVAIAVQDVHTAELGERAVEIARLTAELESQETKYRAKVEAVKEEHAQLLKEAFEKAKNEADTEHRDDLQLLRGQSQETINELRQAHQATLDDITAHHEADLAEQLNALEKKLSSQAIELKATQDDLAKAKAVTAATLSETEGLKSQLEQAQQSAVALASSSSSEHADEIERLSRQLAAAKDDLSAHQEILSATKATITEMASNHIKELEEAAKSRAEEFTRLRSAHDANREDLIQENSELATRLSDLQGDIATLKADKEADTAMSSKSNGSTPVVNQGVTKEELQRLHEAHNLKIRDIEAEHEKVLKVLREEVEAFQTKADELQAEVARKAMEIQYLEQEQDEQTDTITRLQEELAGTQTISQE